MRETLQVCLLGLDCPNCAAKIEERVNKLANVNEATLNFANSQMTVQLNELAEKENVLVEIKKIVVKLEPKVKVKEKQSHPHEHDHEHDHGFQEANKNKLYLRFGVGILLFLIGIFYKGNEGFRFAMFFASYWIFGGDVVIKAFKNLFSGNFFDENFLMTIATMGAFFIGEFPEGVAVMIFYQVGEYFQDLAVGNSRRSIKSLLDITPQFANVLHGDELKKVNPAEVNVGDLILVKAGEKVPVDGIIVDGKSQLDTSSLTGEFVPASVDIGDNVLSGTINLAGVLKIKVTKEYADSTVSKIMELVENASAKKSQTEKFITKFSKVYTPVVVFLAVALSLVPPMLTPEADFKIWISRALVFLVVSCPCALVISVPLGFFAGIGEASKNGILVKGSNYLQALHDADKIVFDKTGTLTKGTFSVSKVSPASNISEATLLETAYAIEKMSNHPIAKSIVKHFKSEKNSDIKDFVEVGGQGLRAIIDGNEILSGNAALMKAHHIPIELYEDGNGTAVYVAKNNLFLGYIVISDEIKEDSKKTIEQLKKLGIKQTVMLTGDRKQEAEKVAGLLGIDTVFSELLPQDKVSNLEKLGGKTIFVGDGINDAPVLARADVGIAMGALGSDAAIESADIVITNDALLKIVLAKKIAKNTITIVKQNIGFALGVKFIVLVLGAFGLASMWLAIFADVGVALLAVLNSMRKKA